MSKISAEVIAHSINEFGDELITYVVTFPRIVLAEFNTHRMFSRNSASSRAIPFNKMVESVQNNPFIPIAWQKEHKGMQGTGYFTDTENDIPHLERMWLSGRDNAISTARSMTNCFENADGSIEGTTKQLCNRLLEPFMWHTVLCTSTEWENFFALRNPQYQHQDGEIFRSWKDLVNDSFKSGASRDWIESLENYTTLERLQCNKGQAEIHMMALAEAMWDAKNESTPEILMAGEWHIPYRQQIVEQFDTEENEVLNEMTNVPIMALISSVMCARVSYTVTGVDLSEWTEDKYVTKALELANADPLHASPFEHCAQAMSPFQYNNFTKTVPPTSLLDTMNTNGACNVERGWCRNFKGFIQLRHIIEQNKING